MHRWTRINENYNKYRITKRRQLLASSALFILLAACSRDVQDTSGHYSESDRNNSVSFIQPESAQYHRNQYDDYYSKILGAMAMTANVEIKKSLEDLYQQPFAQWLNGKSGDDRRLIKENIQGSLVEGSIPVFVAYNIPNRDLGGEARGGMGNGAEYKEWIQDVSRTIGQAPAVLVLEPDALAGVTLIQSQVERQERLSLLRDALVIFQNNKNLATYLDVGNSKWLSVQKVVELISQVDGGSDIVGGISLNVSSYRSERETREYADKISNRFGRKLHVMIDNSRNGASNTDSLQGWCNVEGQKLGKADRYYDATQLVETAYIKTPGESDGRCGTSDKPAGTFDPNVLIDLASQ